MKNKSLITTIIIITILVLSLVNVVAGIGLKEDSKLRPAPAINVEKIVSNIPDGEAKIGDILTFTILVENNGNAALNINVEDVMSCGFHIYLESIEPIDPYNGYCYENSIYTMWKFNQILPGSQIEITYSAKVVDCGHLTNSVVVEGVSTLSLVNGVTTRVTDEDNVSVEVKCEQQPELEEYTLTINKEGEGTVHQNPYNTTYTAGKDVELTAEPNEGWEFNHWTGDITGNTNPKTIKMNSNKTITAHFTQQYTTDTYTLTINTIGNGTVAKNLNLTNYNTGTNVTLNATADAGWQFDHWNEDIEDNTTSKTITINSNITINATFIPLQYTPDTYTLTINTIGNGTITKTPNQANYTPGTNIILTANPDTGWQFDHWNEDIEDNTTSKTIIINSNKTITAYFIEQEQQSEEDNSENDAYTTGDNTDNSDPSSPDNSNLINNYNSGYKKQDFSQYYIIIGCILLVAILILFLLKSDEENAEKNVKNPNENKRIHYPYIPKTVCQIIDSKHATAKNQY